MKKRTSAVRMEKKRFWEDHIREWRVSGLTQAVYCRRHRIGEKCFGYWKRKLTCAGLTVSLVGLVRLDPVPVCPVSKPSQLRVGKNSRIDIERGFDGRLSLNSSRCWSDDPAVPSYPGLSCP